jgi:hypothetical protein
VLLKRTIPGLALFAAAFGVVEAAVVVDLHSVYDPIHARVYPGSPSGALFPLVPPAHLEAACPRAARLLEIELLREAATLLVLAGAALAASRCATQWLGSFLLSFGIWDVAYYAALKGFLGWPDSLLALDLLFLLPVPWAGPVLAPLLVAVSMVLGGAAILVRKVAIRARHWGALGAGGAIVTAAFVRDWDGLLAGAEPRAFPWLLFGVGESLAAGVLLAASRGR